MKRTICYDVICGSVFLYVGLTAFAANKTKPSPQSIDAMERVLEQESQSTTTSLDRRDALKPESRPVSDPNPIWWQAGYVQTGSQWLPYEKSVATGEQAAKLEEYRDQRLAITDEPHGQWKLANWCRKNEMFDQERVHLLQVLADRDPTVKIGAVYERLGCQKIGDVWVSPHERQEATRIKSEIETSFKRWESKLAAIVQQLDGSPKQRKLAERKLAEITDPSAVPAIVNIFCVSTQSMSEHGVKTLGQIPEYQASRALAGQAVFSPWSPVRKAAIELLKQRKLTEFVPDLLLVLSNPVRTKLNLDARSIPTTAFLAPTPNISMNWDYVWVEETSDTIRVGIRRLFPISTSNNFIRITSVKHPQLHGVVLDSNNGQGLNAASPSVALMELADQSILLDYSADRMNDTRAEWNERVGKVLSDCSNEPMTAEPNAWWKWWANFSSVYMSDQKNVVIVDERKTQPNAPSFSTRTMQISCLVAGTPVWTERGFVAIEQIQPGDRVLAKDIETGELAYKAVLRTTVRPPTPVHHFDIDGKNIVASPGHHFWVSGEGWTKMRELIPNHPIHTATGMRRITAVEDQGRVEAVYNLVVADFHTYFVGEAMVLSHDVLPPSLTNVKIPGRSPR